MATDAVWNSLEITKLVASLVTPLVVAFIGYGITVRLKAQEQRFESAREKEREDLRRQYELQNQLAAEERQARNEELRQQAEWRAEREQLDREAKKEALERRHTPHIELRIDCQFFGMRNGPTPRASHRGRSQRRSRHSSVPEHQAPNPRDQRRIV